METLSQESRPGTGLRSMVEGQAYLNKINQKIHALATRFASGDINRLQFQELYAHYQNERGTIETLLAAEPDTEAWKEAITDGASILIRHRHIARVQGFSIFENESGIPLKTIGHFGVDPALFVPMLSAYRSATEEIFGAGVLSSQIEGGKWLCFVRGELTTTLALFTTEPSNKQLKNLEELQIIFEGANRNQLHTQRVFTEELVCPHEFFIRHPL